MAEIYAVVSRVLKLPDTVTKVHLNEPLVYGDNLAHAMRVKVYDEDGRPVPLSGCTVTGTFLNKADNTTVTPITGTTDGNTADVVLPQSCYAVPGRFEFTMNIADGSNYRATMLVDGRVEKRTSNSIVDPGTPVTNYTQVISDATSAATAASNAAYAAENVLALKEDLIGHFADSIIPYTHPLMDLHSPYVDNGTTYGVRWNFDDNQEDLNSTSSSAGNMYYAIYKIPKDTKLLKIHAYHYTDKWAAYGFYDILPGTTGAVVLGKYTGSSSANVGPSVVAVPDGAAYLVIHPAKLSAGRGVYPFVRTNFNVSAEQRPDVSFAMRWNVFEHFFGDGEKWNYRIKHVVMTSNKIYAAVSYESMVPFRIIEKSHPSLFDNTAGAETAFDIENYDESHGTGDPVYFGAMTDTSNTKVLQVFHMAHYNGYLYVTLRAGSDPSDPDHTNSYLVVINASTRRSTFQIPDNDRITTVRVIDSRLLVGKRKSGWTLYSLQDPSQPTEIVSGAVPTGFRECQHGCIFSVGYDEYVAIACYEHGLAIYPLVVGTDAVTAGTPTTWANLSSFGQNLNIFCVESYTVSSKQYLYATVSTTNDGRKNGRNKSGIMAFDVSTPSDIKFLSFTEIPKEQWGNPALRVKHDSGSFIFATISDPSPNYVRILGTKLYTNNEDKGIAVFDISDPANPVFQGHIPLGTWPSYFELYAGSGNAGDPPGVIVAGGNYDFIHGKQPAVVAVTTVLGG